MANPLKQKVNFYVSVGLIAAFGFLMSVTIVQAYARHSTLTEYVTSPIDLNYDYSRY